MTLEELLKRTLNEEDTLLKLLSTYQGKPSIFSYMAPLDESGYVGNEKYPYITFAMLEGENQKRKNNGSLKIQIYYKESENSVEEIANGVKSCLNQRFLKPKDVPSCFRFYKTRDFIESSYRIKELIFDRFDYEKQETTDPDPIATLQQHLKKSFQELVLLGMEDFGEVKKIDNQNCMVYCALKSMERGEETYSLTWMDCKIAIHVIHPSMVYRQKVLAGLMNTLSTGDELNSFEDIPMFIKALDLDYKRDMFSEGQLILTFHYGLPRYMAKPHVLTGAQFNYLD